MRASRRRSGLFRSELSAVLIYFDGERFAVIILRPRLTFRSPHAVPRQFPRWDLSARSVTIRGSGTVRNTGLISSFTNEGEFPFFSSAWAGLSAGAALGSHGILGRIGVIARKDGTSGCFNDSETRRTFLQMVRVMSLFKDRPGPWSSTVSAGSHAEVQLLKRRSLLKMYSMLPAVGVTCTVARTLPLLPTIPPDRRATAIRSSFLSLRASTWNPLSSIDQIIT